MSARHVALAAFAVAAVVASCARQGAVSLDAPVAAGTAPASASADATTVATNAPPAPSSSANASPSGSASASATGPLAQSDKCPAGMAYVSGSFCPQVERKCLHEELIKDENITICHKFAPETKCLAPVEARTFCIDRYEYPNEAGGHPPWMVSWYDAEATCESKGKRLCYDGEWTMACEGPAQTPFPNGWERDNTACNIDNEFIRPNMWNVVSKKPGVSITELERVDQSIRSGSMPRCMSGYGVYDTTGNFDEWVTRETPAGYRRKDDTSKWAGLKGGAWGHVRNACRPMTTSHIPEFIYYFVSFRCCADAAGATPFVPKNAVRPPKVVPEDRAPTIHVTHPVGPSPTKVKKDRGY